MTADEAMTAAVVAVGLSTIHRCIHAPVTREAVTVVASAMAAAVAISVLWLPAVVAAAVAGYCGWVLREWQGQNRRGRPSKVAGVVRKVGRRLTVVKEGAP